MDRKWFVTIIIILCIAVFLFIYTNRKTEKGQFDIDYSVNKVDQYDIGAIEEANLYSNENPPFSFRYPDDFSVSSFEDTDKSVVLVQKSEDQAGLQIYISDFSDDKEGLTPQRIQRDIPSIVMVNVQPVFFGGKETGLIFVSTRDNEKVREMWFVYEGWLYQITTPLSFDEALEKIMNTWQFN